MKTRASGTEMETTSVSGGLWNSPRVSQSCKETQDRLRVMKEESRLTNLQRKQINKCPKNTSAVALTSDPTPLSSSCKYVQKRPPGFSQKRSAESCRSGDSYVREKFCPGPTRDLEKEKKRLQNILATGKDELPAASSKKAPESCNSEESEEDRYEEVLNEIEERRQFLADMVSLGQEQQYIHIINSEISQKIRELELLEKAHNPK